jgi:membrane fusion protein (multidrug efflux system)
VFYGGLALGVSMLLAGCGGAPAPAPKAPPHVDVIVMQPGDVERDMVFSGRTSAYRIAEICPQVSGILQRRQFEEGTDVVKGQTLYQVDPSTYQAVYDRAVATAASTGALARAIKRSSLIALSASSSATMPSRPGVRPRPMSSRPGSIFSVRASMPRSRAVSAAR